MKLIEYAIYLLKRLRVKVLYLRRATCALVEKSLRYPVSLFYPNSRPYDKYSNDNLIGALLSTTPIPGLGAGYISHQSAKKGPEDKYWGHFASGMMPGTAAGLGAAVGSGVVSHKLLRRLGRTRNLSPALRRWVPIAVGALTGALIEPMATNVGLGAYKFFNRD